MGLSNLGQVLREFAAAFEEAPPGHAPPHRDDQALGGLLCQLEESEVDERREGLFPKWLVTEIPGRDG